MPAISLIFILLVPCFPAENVASVKIILVIGFANSIISDFFCLHNFPLFRLIIIVHRTLLSINPRTKWLKIGLSFFRTFLSTSELGTTRKVSWSILKIRLRTRKICRVPTWFELPSYQVTVCQAFLHIIVTKR